MTKSTITREQLRALAVKKIESLKFAITQSAFTNIRRGLEDELQLAKFALAAMDNETVGNEFIPKNLDKALGVVGMALPESKEEFNFQIERWVQRLIDRVIRYADEFQEPPAPVVPLVPDDVSGPLAHAYKELTPTFMRNHIAVFERYGIAPNDSSTVIQALRIALDGIERRAAMLQAEPVTTANKLGNSPVIPDTWIPVSERMPEDSGRYWCYVEEQNDLGKSHYQWNCSWNGDRWWVESEGGGIVTHWMQLPAAPQEVK